MRLPLFGLFLAFVSFVAAISTQGSKLLVVIESDADKSKYSQFWSDLEGEQYTTIDKLSH
jgi:oligosaccharyltransferase complex subunit beta